MFPGQQGGRSYVIAGKAVAIAATRFADRQRRMSGARIIALMASPRPVCRWSAADSTWCWSMLIPTGWPGRRGPARSRHHDLRPLDGSTPRAERSYGDEFWVAVVRPRWRPAVPLMCRLKSGGQLWGRFRSDGLEVESGRR